ncbi:MAG: hypothetical protein LBS02_04060 [Hungatella sp.]|nr:hypothetical protein [Hungatella sp.]
MLKNTVFSNGQPISRLARSPVFVQLPTGSAVGNSMEPDAIIRCAERYLSLLWDRMHKEMFSCPVIQADETPWKTHCAFCI